MIESCPSTQSQQSTLSLYRQFNMNNMVKVRFLHQMIFENFADFAFENELGLKIIYLQ